MFFLLNSIFPSFSSFFHLPSFYNQIDVVCNWWMRSNHSNKAWKSTHIFQTIDNSPHSLYVYGTLISLLLFVEKIFHIKIIQFSSFSYPLFNWDTTTLGFSFHLSYLKKKIRFVSKHALSVKISFETSLTVLQKSKSYSLKNNLKCSLKVDE